MILETPDVNVLVHAFRKDSKSHALCHEWLENRINDPAPFAISSIVLSGFLRIVTHSKIFKQPSSLDEALEFCEIIKSSPSLIFIEPSSRHWKIFKKITTALHSRGNEIPDAWLAALAIEHQCRWVTFDKAFLKYPELQTELLR